MNIKGKKALRILGLAVGVLLVLLVAVWIFLPAEKIRDLALDQARQQLGREVTVEDVRVTVLGGLGVSLDRFVIHNPPGFEGPPLLQARTLKLNVAFLPLLKKEIRVHSLVVGAPELNLQVRPDGTDNFTFAGTGPAAGGKSGDADRQDGEAPPLLEVDRLLLTEGRLGYTDARTPAPAVASAGVTGLKVDLALEPEPRGGFRVRGRAEVPSLSLGTAVTVPPLQAEADFEAAWQPDPAAVVLDRLDLRVNDIPMSGSGRLALDGPAPAGTLALDLPDLPLVELFTLAPPDLAGRLRGHKGSGQVGARVEVSLPGQPDQPVGFAGQFRARDVDLVLAQPFLPAERSGRVQGRADLQLDFRGNAAAPADLDYGGTLELRAVSYTESGLVDDLLDLQGGLRVEPGLVEITRSRARFGAGTFELTGTLRDPLPYFLPPELQKGGQVPVPHFDFALTTARLDVDRLIPAASPAAGAAGEATAPRTQPEPLDMEFPDLTADGTFAADTLLYMQVPFTGVEGKIRLRNRVLACYDVTGAVYQGRIDGQVDVGLQDLDQPSFAGRYHARDIEVDRFLERFVGLGGVVFGACGLEGSFAARGRDPEVIRNSLSLAADAAIRQGRVVTGGDTYEALSRLAGQLGQSLDQEQALRDLATHISVQDGRVALENLTTGLGQLGDLTLGGSYAFSGELDYSGSLLLSEQQTARLFSGGVMGELGKLLGEEKPQRLALPLSVTGWRTDPHVKLDLAAVTEELQQGVAREQGRKLEDKARDKLNDLLKKWK